MSKKMEVMIIFSNINVTGLMSEDEYKRLVAGDMGNEFVYLERPESGFVGKMKMFFNPRNILTIEILDATPQQKEPDNG